VRELRFSVRARLQSCRMCFKMAAASAAEVQILESSRRLRRPGRQKKSPAGDAGLEAGGSYEQNWLVILVRRFQKPRARIPVPSKSKLAGSGVITRYSWGEHGPESSGVSTKKLEYSPG